MMYESDISNLITDLGGYANKIPLQKKRRTIYDKMYDEHKDDESAYGEQLFFSAGFLYNERLVDDFPAIIREFVLNCGNRIDEFEPYSHGEYGMSILIGIPVLDLFAEVISVMYSGAMHHDDKYCKDLIVYLYKTYYKREYNQIKRFSNVDYFTLFKLVFDEMEEEEEEEELDTTRSQMIDSEWARLGRICVMSKLLGNYKENEDKPFESKALLNGMADKVIEDIIDAFFEDTQELIDEEVLQINEYASHVMDDEKNKSEILQQGNDYIYFVNTLLTFYGMQDGCIGLDEFIDITDFVTALTVMNVICENEPEDKKNKFLYGMPGKELHSYAFIASLVRTFVNWINRYSKILCSLINPLDADETNKTMTRIAALGDPGKIKKEVKESKVVIPVKREPIEEELAELRRKLREKESSEKALRLELEEQKKLQKQYDELLKEHENLKIEAAALRDFAYNASEKKDVESETPDLEMMKAFLKNKEILIIGGHTKWTAKLRKEFPKWRFVHLNDTSTVDPYIARNKDYIFFFTDYFAHKTYYKFLSVLREYEIPFGYLSGVNIDNTIVNIYDEIKRKS